MSLDLAKAFDRVSWNGLWLALHFFFPPHLFPRLSVALHDCFTGQSPGTRLARRARRAKVQSPGKLRQGGGGDWRKEGLAGLPPRVGSS